jgi:hypothetical protein
MSEPFFFQRGHGLSVRDIAGAWAARSPRSTRTTASAAPRAATNAPRSMRSARPPPGGNLTWWSVDRLGRSLQDLVAFLSELHGLGLDLFLHQQGIDTTTPAGKAMFQMMGVFAEFERSIIQERIRAGLARARSEGKRLGRPPIGGARERPAAGARRSRGGACGVRRRAAFTVPSAKGRRMS